MGWDQNEVLVQRRKGNCGVWGRGLRGRRETTAIARMGLKLPWCVPSVLAGVPQRIAFGAAQGKKFFLPDSIVPVVMVKNDAGSDPVILLRVRRIAKKT